jgi:putative cardiolipin synthase
MAQPAVYPAFQSRGHGWSTLLRLSQALALGAALAACASLPANVARPASTAFDAPDSTALGQLTQQRRTAAAARSDSGFRLLDSVDLAFTSRLALIDAAQRTLDLQYYAIHADSSTEQLLERVRAAAARGVRVRILLDDFNSVGADAQVLRLAFLPNVQLRLYNPLPGSRASLLGRIFTSLADVGQLQKRMHNKLFIADNAWGIAGGRNLGDAYFGRGEDSNFVDLDVLATGRLVRDMSASFDRYWNNKLAYPVEALLDRDELERLRKPQPAAGAAAPGPLAPSVSPASAPAPAFTHTASVLPDVTTTGVQSRDLDLQRTALTWAPSALLVDQPGKVGPDDDEVDAGDTVIDGLLGLMAQARADLLIVSPYFVPGQQMMDTFAGLRGRGVRIRVLTNSLASNDAPAAHAGYARYRKRLLELGIELYEMRAEQEGSAGGLGSGINAHASGTKSAFGSGGGVGGSKASTGRASLHSKAVIIDGRLAVIGSMNLDLRSQLKNSEVALVIRSPALSQQAIKLVENSLAKGAYRLELAGGSLRWRAPTGAPFKDASSEPDASAKLKLLVNLLGPLAPDEML